MAKVYLVGAGPGDPGLITLRALELIKKADVIIYDRLVSEKVLKHAKSGAELVYVGKRTGSHTFAQEEINRIILEKAVRKKVVVRLKGGDPFVFGRGGEEALVLKKNKIPFEVVPGVTSAIAVPAIAGIPVTDRRYASSFTVVTGHEGAGKGGIAIARPQDLRLPDGIAEQDRIASRLPYGIDYSSLKADTVVVLMGVEKLGEIVAQMLKSRDKKTPVAIIEEGTTKKQRVVVSTLQSIVKKAEKEKVKPPAVIVVGEVVRLRKKLTTLR